MSKPWQVAYSWLVFPFILTATIGGAILLAPNQGMARAVLMMQTLGVLLVAVSERLLPYHPSWNHSQGDLRTDLMHVVVSGAVIARYMQPLSIFLGSMFAAMLSTAVGSTLWPTTSPYLVQLVLALLVAEFTQYWVHRWQHEHEILWRLHAAHHSAPRLYWLNAARFHPLDLGLLYLVGYVPLAILGCPGDTILLFGLFDAVFGMMQHCNIDVRLGPLNYIFSMAEPHRWHHSRVLEEANTNYGSNLILWDLVFGSFFLPQDRQPPKGIGISDMPNFPADYLGQLTSPFRWRELERIPVRPQS